MESMIININSTVFMNGTEGKVYFESITKTYVSVNVNAIIFY